MKKRLKRVNMTIGAHYLGRQTCPEHDCKAEIRWWAYIDDLFDPPMEVYAYHGTWKPRTEGGSLAGNIQNDTYHRCSCPSGKGLAGRVRDGVELEVTLNRLGWRL